MAAMPAVLKLRKVGNSIGIILPKEELNRFQLEVGDELTFVRTESGFEISPYDREFEMKLKTFEKSRRKYRNALRELAK
jgi:putative addiction module antidote